MSSAQPWGGHPWDVLGMSPPASFSPKPPGGGAYDTWGAVFQITILAEHPPCQVPSLEPELEQTPKASTHIPFWEARPLRG